MGVTQTVTHSSRMSIGCSLFETVLLFSGDLATALFSAGPLEALAKQTALVQTRFDQKGEERPQRENSKTPKNKLKKKKSRLIPKHTQSVEKF